MLSKCGKVQVFGKRVTSKLRSQRNEDRLKFGECLLPFCSEYFVFPSPLI